MSAVVDSQSPDAGFEPHRRRLLGLAYRMLGSMADAEDAVQEAYLRWHSTDRDRICDSRAFLMTITTRICLDVLASARVRREHYVGPWLPEPVLDSESLRPDTKTELAEDLSVALLLTLERLSPLERAAFLLHDVFDFTFTEVAEALDRPEASCRQLASRARSHVRGLRPRGAATVPEGRHNELLSAFIEASRSGDLTSITHFLIADVRVVTDGGGKVPAALNVIEGSDRAARFLAGVARNGWREDYTLRFATINNLPGLVVESPQGPVQTTAFDIADGRIRAIYIVRNPDKLRYV